MAIQNATIEHAVRRAVRYQDGVLVQLRLDGLQVDPNLILGPLVDASHERQRVLIADKIEDPVFNTLPMNGVMIVRRGSEFNPILITHQVHDRPIEL